jgi:hypothetical protein
MIGRSYARGLDAQTYLSQQFRQRKLWQSLRQLGRLAGRLVDQEIAE